jgi:hypothetical protein
VLYALIGATFATNVGELEQDAQQGDVWYQMVRQVAYLAYYQDPPSAKWHLPPGAFHPESLDQQATQTKWVTNAGMRVFTVVSRQDAKAALRDIGLQGEGLKTGTGGSDSHYERFLKVYRGETGVALPYPDKGGWVPAYAVPTDPRVSNDATDPRAIANPVAQDWAKLANLRYALLLGFLEQYFFTKPSDRDFLKDYAIDEMKTLKLIGRKLVTLPRLPNGGGMAALPFELPNLIHLPDQPAQQWPVHIGRIKEVLALVNKMLAAAGDQFLMDIQTADKGKLKKLEQMGAGAGGGAGGQSRLDRMRDILNSATGTGTPNHGGAKRFWNLPRSEFVQAKVYGLTVIETTGDNRGARSNLIKALKGEAPFDDTDFPRMPLGRPPVSPENIAFIQKWIDDGCPDEPM